MKSRKSKVKNEDKVRQVGFAVLWSLMTILLGFGISMMILFVQSYTQMCIPMADADFVMYGFDVRDARSDSEALLMALSEMELHGVDALPDGVRKHVYVDVYDEFRLIGTLLFWHEPNMTRWHVVVSDGNGDCGVYRVWQVERVFDALRIGGA